MSGAATLPAGTTALPSPAEGVDVWLCQLERAADEVARLGGCLAPEELARAQRFGRPALRDRYIVGRATLRALLGLHLGIDAAHVRIARGARGRPFMPDAAGVDFNVSHTGGVALIGIAHGLRIGVDIELADRRVNVEGVARKFMTPREQAGLGKHEFDARRQRLLRLWTCKEAMSKATGDGLIAPFRAIDIEIEPALRVVTGPAPYGPSDWRLLPALVTADQIATVALWRGP